jgi:uncharacterized glyoxalase superfamily protein PhnB
MTVSGGLDEKALIEAAQRDPRRFAELYARYALALEASLSPPADQPCGDRMAYVQDPGGNIWYIATRRPPHVVG